MEKEKWKDEVLNSVRGIKRAEPNPFLFTRIEVRLKSLPGHIAGSVITFPKLSLAFAGIALLFALNFAILKKTGSDNFASNYSLDNINYQLY